MNRAIFMDHPDRPTCAAYPLAFAKSETVTRAGLPKTT